MKAFEIGLLLGGIFLLSSASPGGNKLVEKGNFKTSNNGLELIKGFEGLVLSPYWDVSGWSVGYGHFLGDISKPSPITEAKANEYLMQDIKIVDNALNKYIDVPLTQNEIDALSSFTYNLGSGNLSKSTLLKDLNKGDKKSAASNFDLWVKAGGKVLSALVERRAIEKELFLS